MILVAWEPDARSGIQSSFIRRTKGNMAMYVCNCMYIKMCTYNPPNRCLNKSACLLCCSPPKISSFSTHHPSESGLFVDLGDSTCLTYCTQGVMLRWLEADPDLRDTTHIFADEVRGCLISGSLQSP